MSALAEERRLPSRPRPITIRIRPDIRPASSRPPRPCSETIGSRITTKAAVVADPPPGTDYVQYLVWYIVYSRMPLEVIAHRQGIALDPVAESAERPSRQAAGHAALLARPGAPAGASAAAAYEVDTSWRIAEYLRRADLLGPACEAADLDEASALLGYRPVARQRFHAARIGLTLAHGHGMPSSGVSGRSRQSTSYDDHPLPPGREAFAHNSARYPAVSSRSEPAGSLARAEH